MKGRELSFDPATMNLRELAFDHSRGTGAMWLFMATEAFLFIVLFFAYGFLGYQSSAWPPEHPPEQRLALIMLGVLLASSIVLHLAERRARAESEGWARIFLGLTVVLGVIFVMLQIRETMNHLQDLRPWTDAYGSVFYTITSIHGLHLLLGLMMLVYVLLLPTTRPLQPWHAALHNAALYWHFVDLVWVIIVFALYLFPIWSGASG